MSNKAMLDDLIRGYREERDGLKTMIDNLAAGRTFLGTPNDIFGAENKEAELASLRRQVSDLDTIISGHDAGNA